MPDTLVDETPPAPNADDAAKARYLIARYAAMKAAAVIVKARGWTGANGRPLQVTTANWQEIFADAGQVAPVLPTHADGAPVTTRRRKPAGGHTATKQQMEAGRWSCTVCEQDLPASKYPTTKDRLRETRCRGCRGAAKQVTA